MKTHFFIKKILEPIFPSVYQFKRISIITVIRFFFLLVSFTIYIVLASHIPNDIFYKLEIAMIVTLTVSTLFILPSFEKLSHYLKGKFLSEYLFEDPSVSRLAYKKFDIHSLIKSVFPDMVKISGSESGRIAILNADGTFDIYTYNRGRQKKVHTREENTPMNQIIQFLLKKKKPVSISETVDLPEINEDFVALRADFILPFLFREKIFGFLAISSIPKNEDLQQLNLLSRQCALIVHNQNLSSQIVENLKYRQEDETANRIQTALQVIKPPTIPGLTIEHSTRNPSLILEFFQTKDNRWNFLILTAGGPARSAGLIHSYIRGLLFSRLTQNKAQSFVEIKEVLIQTFQKAEWKEKYGYIIGKISDDYRLELLQEGNMFRVFSEVFPERALTSIGWKNIVQPESYPIQFEFYGKQLMRFELS